MIFFLTALDQQGETREFYCQQSALEEGFDLLDAIAASGDVLTKAVVFDGEHTIELPIDAFDGQPVSPTITALEQEWQKLLLEPINPSAYRQWALDQMNQRISVHETIMLMLKQAIDETQQRLSRIRVDVLREPYRSRIIHQLTLNLERYQVLFTSEQTSWRNALNHC